MSETSFLPIFAVVMSLLAVLAALVALWRVSIHEAIQKRSQGFDSVVRHEIVQVPYSAVPPGVTLPPDDGQIERDIEHDQMLVDARMEFPEIAQYLEDQRNGIMQKVE